MSASKNPAPTKTGKDKKVRPLGLADSPLAHAITRKLIGFYLLITALFSLLLIGFSFYGETSRLEQQARFLGEASLPILGEALWSFDDVQRDSAAEVLLRHEEITGVGIRFLDADKKPQKVTHGRTLEIPQDARLTEAIAAKMEVFEKIGWLRMPIYHEEQQAPKILIGELTLFINNQLALKRHVGMAAAVIGIGVLAAIFNWLVYRTVLNREIAEPFRLIIVKLLQVQKILPETEVTPENFRKLKIERFGTEFRLLEKQLEKIIIANLTLAEAVEEAKNKPANPVNAPAESTQDSIEENAGAEESVSQSDTAASSESAGTNETDDGAEEPASNGQAATGA